MIKLFSATSKLFLIVTIMCFVVAAICFVRGVYMNGLTCLMFGVVGVLARRNAKKRRRQRAIPLLLRLC